MSLLRLLWYLPTVCFFLLFQTAGAESTWTDGVVRYIPADPPLSSIGIVVQQRMDDSIVVSGVFDNTPAQKADLHVKDVILSVENLSIGAPIIVHQNGREIMERLRTSPNTRLRLKLSRNGVTRQCELYTVAITAEDLIRDLKKRLDTCPSDEQFRRCTYLLFTIATGNLNDRSFNFELLEFNLGTAERRYGKQSIAFLEQLYLLLLYSETKTTYKAQKKESLFHQYLTLLPVLELPKENLDDIISKSKSLIGFYSRNNEESKARAIYEATSRLLKTNRSLQTKQEADLLLSKTNFKENSSKERQIAISKESLEILGHAFGKDDPRLLPRMYQLIFGYVQNSQYYAAKELLERARSIAKKHDRCGEYLETNYSNWADYYKRQKQFQEAEHYYKLAKDLVVANIDNPVSALIERRGSSLYDYALFLHQQGRLSDEQEVKLICKMIEGKKKEHQMAEETAMPE